MRLQIVCDRCGKRVDAGNPGMITVPSGSIIKVLMANFFGARLDFCNEKCRSEYFGIPKQKKEKKKDERSKD